MPAPATRQRARYTATAGGMSSVITSRTAAPAAAASTGRPSWTVSAGTAAVLDPAREPGLATREPSQQGRVAHRQPGPQRIEVEEEEHGDAQVRVGDGPPGSANCCQARQHEGQRQDHEDQPAEHVVEEEHSGDPEPGQVLADETEQDHG